MVTHVKEEPIRFSNDGKEELVALCGEGLKNPKYINLVFIRNSPVLENELIDNKVTFNYLVGPDNYETISEVRKTNGSYHSTSQTVYTNDALDAINIAIVTYDIKDLMKQFLQLHPLIRSLKTKWGIDKWKMNKTIRFVNYKHPEITEDKKYWMFFDLTDEFIVDVTMRFLFTNFDDSIEQ